MFTDMRQMSENRMVAFAHELTEKRRPDDFVRRAGKVAERPFGAVVGEGVAELKLLDHMAISVCE
jgi:hypothetical protein